jgi:hypothetical protein
VPALDPLPEPGANLPLEPLELGGYPKLRAEVAVVDGFDLEKHAALP